LELRFEDGKLRLYDPKTEEYLRTHEESEAERRSLGKRVARELRARQKADARATIAEAKAAALAAENLRLREELAKLRRNGNGRS